MATNKKNLGVILWQSTRCAKTGTPLEETDINRFSPSHVKVYSPYSTMLPSSSKTGATTDVTDSHGCVSIEFVGVVGVGAVVRDGVLALTDGGIGGRVRVPFSQRTVWSVGSRCNMVCQPVVNRGAGCFGGKFSTLWKLFGGIFHAMELFFPQCGKY